MNFKANLDRILQKHQDLSAKMSDASIMHGKEFAVISKEYSNLTPVVEQIDIYNNLLAEQQDLNELLQDPEMKEEVELEIIKLKKKLPEVEKQIQILLLPKDEADEKNAIVEIRAGTGGEEAALFGATLLRMYQRYAENKGWKTEIIAITSTGIGGCKEASMLVSGKNVYSFLKFESGVHRVQRVPETESSGRIHTSAATVAVLPEAEDVDIDIDEKDIRIDVFRASGAGGQHVNTTESAVRITHIPTGIVVSQQDEKSQHKNKAKAMKILRSRLYDVKRQEAERDRAASRKEQIGSGDRSERIRTYNYPQGRVTDHRINLTLYKINDIVEQGDLDELINPLISDNEARKLATPDCY